MVKASCMMLHECHVGCMLRRTLVRSSSVHNLASNLMQNIVFWYGGRPWKEKRISTLLVGVGCQIYQWNDAKIETFSMSMTDLYEAYICSHHKQPEPGVSYTIPK